MGTSRTKEKQNKIDSKSDCPCQSGLLFQQCCQRFLAPSSTQTATQPAKTAEQLMRSRYCAYVLGNETYLLQTWHPKTRPAHLNLNDSPNRWIGLKIKTTTLGQESDSIGTVHFIARYKTNGKAHKLEENSQFEKINDHWLYVKGDFPS
ncbi:MAG: YchJ family metal-binding protein [Gammaproteobacteria bacterium]|nr:YchJ family metal-binding protein [Gammaproteobacteria bacterium]